MASEGDGRQPLNAGRAAASKRDGIAGPGAVGAGSDIGAGGYSEAKPNSRSVRAGSNLSRPETRDPRLAPIPKPKPMPVPLPLPLPQPLTLSLPHTLGRTQVPDCLIMIGSDPSGGLYELLPLSLHYKKNNITILDIVRVLNISFIYGTTDIEIISKCS